MTPEIFNKNPAPVKAVKKVQEKASEVVAPVAVVDPVGPVDINITKESGSKPTNQDINEALKEQVVTKKAAPEKPKKSTINPDKLAAFIKMGQNIAEKKKVEQAAAAPFQELSVEELGKLPLAE